MCRTNTTQLSEWMSSNGSHHVIYTHAIFMGPYLCSTVSYKTRIPPRHVCCNDAEIALARWRPEHDKNGFYDAPRLRLLYFIRTWRRSGSWLQSEFAFESYNNIILCLYLSPTSAGTGPKILPILGHSTPWWRGGGGIMVDDRINHCEWTIN